ncbi:SHOCT domain-containing protein [Rhodococcus sp. NPDC127530]|uniref:SHOCT domain-containing protein n=1 Tax=unclassified Rhodococcus (in: high G+C Gram-positive bacteria) TaxID=192944 RepID=UPI00362B8F57
MPGLLRGIARTAVVAGTAAAVSNRVSRRQGQRWAANQSAPQQETAPPPPPPPPAQPAPPSGGTDRIATLKQLGELRDQGVLTEEEFNTEKAKILAS